MAIDGPTGAGKSTVARALADALGFTYLNTGAMYRAAAIAARRAGLDPDAPGVEAQLVPMLAGLKLELARGHVLLDGEDVAPLLSDPAISDLASRLSALAIVRARMLELQRAAGANGAIVMEGRDIGTVIFPGAEFKFFLGADLPARASRRYQELISKGVDTDLGTVRAEIEARDRRDQERALAPLKPAPDAIMIDSTHASVAEVVARLVELINARKPN